MFKRLILSYGLLLIVFAIALTLLLSTLVNRNFNDFAARHLSSHLSSLPVELAQAYAVDSTWADSGRMLARYADVLNMEVVLTDTDNRVVAATNAVPLGRPLADLTWTDLSLSVEETSSGRLIGFVYLAVDQTLSTSFVSSIQQTALIVTLVGLLAALAVSLLLARSLSQPMMQLSQASKQVAQGDYDVRVDERFPAEVGDLALAFNQMADKIGNLERVRRTLVLNVSHDLRTPLTILNGYLEGLRTGAIADRRSAEQAFEVMQLEVAHLTGLVDRMNDVAALEAGAFPLEKTETDIVGLVADTVALLRASAEAKGTTLNVETASHIPLWSADAHKLGQLLFNLIDNAIRYGRTNGIVTIRASAEAAHLQLSVSDDGIGIPLEHQPYIFERFYRVQQSRTRYPTADDLKTGGYGMGLAIVRTIAQAHGGSVTVISSGVVGEGSRFDVVVPC